VEVVYDGALEASVILETREWGLGPETAAKGLSLSRSAPSKAVLGEPFEVTLKLKSEKARPFVVVEERIPANAEPELRSLEALKKKGIVSDFKVDGAVLYFYLEKLEGELSLTFSLTAIREGTASHPGSEAHAMYAPEVASSTVGGSLEVKAE